MIKQRINFVRMAVAVITAAAVCAFTTACNFGNSDDKPKEDMVEVTFVAGWTYDEAGWDEGGPDLEWKKTVKIPFGFNGYDKKPGTENLINKGGDAYKQLGWYKQEGDHLAEYEYPFTIPIVRNITLVMKWGNEGPHNVTFNANGGQWADATEEKTINVVFGTDIVPPEGASRQRSDLGSNYVLSGWYLDRECSREFNLKEKLYEDKTVYAYWTDYKFTWQEFLQKYSTETPPQVEISICIEDAAETILSIPDNVKQNLNTSGSITLDLRKASAVTEIIVNGFKDFGTLNTVKLPLGLQKINSFGFNKCGALKNIVFPSSLKEIGASAFLDCDSLVQVNIPEGCENIANRAFAGIDGLRYVYLPSTIGRLDRFVFFESFINFQDEGDLIIYNGTESMFNKIESENTEGEDGEKEVGVKHLEGYLKTDKLYIHHDD